MRSIIDVLEGSNGSSRTGTLVLLYYATVGDTEKDT